MLITVGIGSGNPPSFGNPGQTTGSVRIVAFPSTGTDAGTPGDIAFGTVSGVEWLAVYAGDGTTHSWIFSPFQTSYPT